MREFTNIISNG